MSPHELTNAQAAFETSLQMHEHEIHLSWQRIPVVIDLSPPSLWMQGTLTAKEVHEVLKRVNVRQFPLKRVLNQLLTGQSTTASANHPTYEPNERT